MFLHCSLSIAGLPSAATHTEHQGEHGPSFLISLHLGLQGLSISNVKEPGECEQRCRRFNTKKCMIFVYL